MKNLILIAVIVTATAFNALAQAAKEANPADVASLDTIMKAVYDVISGDAAKTRDWDRFRSLFYKDARLIPSSKNAETGVFGARVLSPNGSCSRYGPPPGLCWSSTSLSGRSATASSTTGPTSDTPARTPTFPS